jgi:two-component system, OmpR family, sensor histidine kinase MtrB
VSLRRNLSFIIAMVAAFSLAAAFSLVTLTNYLRRTSAEVVDALRSIRLIQQLEVDLLEDAQTTDPQQQAFLEMGLQQGLQKAEQYIGSENEQAALLDARQKVGKYLQSRTSMPRRQTPALDAAFASLRTLLDINAAESSQAQAAAGRWDALVNRVVVIVATALFLAVVLVLWWLWKFAFQPVLEIRDAMTSFAGGVKSSRAAEEGPDELRSIAVQFNQMADALARQHENQLVFLTGVAHDLRNPLVPLKMSASALEPGGKTPSEQSLRNVMDMIQRQVDRLDRMIGDLLDASRIEAGQLELRLEEQDARALVLEVYNLFHAASPKHELELTLPRSPVMVRCDPYRIEQVLNNVVSNAIKYSPTGGRIEIALETDVTGAIFKITDEGVGIRAEDLPFVFEPFRRFRGTAGSIPGIGLGLSIAKRIVEAHHGRIDLKSQPGKGTTFRIHLPGLGTSTREVA